MKIRLRYDNQYQELEVSRDEAANWLNIEITPDMSDAEAERLANEQAEIQYNRTEYNSWHKFWRHTDPDARPKRMDGTRGKAVSAEDGEDSFAGNMDMFGSNASNEERDHRIHEREVREEIRRKMKPDQAELIIAVILDKVPKQEYAAWIGIKPDALSHRLDTAKRNYRKIFGKPQV